MTYALLIITVFFIFIACVPFKALAEMSEVNYKTPVRCGLHCVIMEKWTYSESEARVWADMHAGKLRHSGDKWFVEYQATEAQAESEVI